MLDGSAPASSTMTSSAPSRNWWKRLLKGATGVRGRACFPPSLLKKHAGIAASLMFAGLWSSMLAMRLAKGVGKMSE